ncbi:MAG: zinc-dependent alcohol dehydrogenase family protein [bacterium]|nr:zinc-dependent alcohol dehydrogenase family protein [bacterium]
MKTRAAVLCEMGKPQPYRESKPLEVGEIDLEGPGPGEVLVQVMAAGVCHSDLSVINASRPRVMPMVMGHEAAGIVRELGQGVTDFAPGDHVIFSFVPMCGRCAYCAIGRPALCETGNRANTAGTLLGGGRRFRRGDTLFNHHLGVSAFSQFTVAAQESLVRIDPDLPLEEAALFGCAVITGVGAVFNTARVEPGTSVAVFGLGGVGLSSVIGALAAGANPILAVDLVPSKLELARRIGATHTVDASASDAVEQIKELTGGGVDYAFESVGHEGVLAQAYAATRRGGTTVTVGLPHPSRQLVIPAVSLVAEERTLRGSYMGSAVPRRDIPRYIAMYRAKRLPVDALVSRHLALDEINSSFDSLDSGAVARQVVRF